MNKQRWNDLGLIEIVFMHIARDYLGFLVILFVNEGAQSTELPYLLVLWHSSMSTLAGMLEIELIQFKPYRY